MKTKTFTHFDAFSEAVSDVDCVMTMHGPRRSSWTIAEVQLPDIHAQFGALGSGNILEGQSSPEGYLLYVPLTGKCEYSANGTVMAPGSLMILEPGCEFRLTSNDEHDWFAMLVPEQQLADQGVIDKSSSTGSASCRTSEPDPRLARRFASALSELFATASRRPDFEASPAASAAEAALVSIAAQVMGALDTDMLDGRGRPRMSRDEIIRRSHEHIEGLPAGRHPSVAELAALNQVSERTLRNAFQEYYGMGPKAYLQLRQLNDVYRDLRVTHPDDASVAQVLLRHGVWEHGRFASRYYRLFGEHPATTLRSAR